MVPEKFLQLYFNRFQGLRQVSDRLGGPQSRNVIKITRIHNRIGVGSLGVELGSSRPCRSRSKINIVRYVKFIGGMFDGFDKEQNISNFIDVH